MFCEKQNSSNELCNSVKGGSWGQRPKHKIYKEPRELEFNEIE
jgi:hypothetical protein